MTASRSLVVTGERLSVQFQSTMDLSKFPLKLSCPIDCCKLLYNKPKFTKKKGVHFVTYSYKRTEEDDFGLYDLSFGVDNQLQTLHHEVVKKEGLAPCPKHSVDCAGQNRFNPGCEQLIEDKNNCTIDFAGQAKQLCCPNSRRSALGQV